jgi:sulfonate transport system substrate-binding protein
VSIPSSRSRRFLAPVGFALLLLSLSLSACKSGVGADAGGASNDPNSARNVAPAGTAKGLDPAHPVTLTIGVPRSFGWLSTMLVRDTQVPGVTIEYKFFPVFGDMLAALNAGQLDLTEAGDVGALASYTNGGKVGVVAVTEPNPHQAGIIVPKDSPISTVADLKGRKVAFLKSTNSYPAILHVLDGAGLKEGDIEIVQVTGPDAATAFASGQLDARSNIDPDMADQIEKLGARLLTDYQGFGENLYPYIATQAAIRDKAEAIRAVIGAVADTMVWADRNPDEQARLLAPKLGFSESAIKTGYARGAKKLQRIDDAFFAREQKVVDEYASLGVIPRKVDAKDVFLTEFNDAIAGSAR